jgi:hypothetical protein
MRVDEVVGKQALLATSLDAIEVKERGYTTRLTIWRAISAADPTSYSTSSSSPLVRPADVADTI